MLVSSVGLIFTEIGAPRSDFALALRLFKQTTKKTRCARCARVRSVFHSLGWHLFPRMISTPRLSRLLAFTVLASLAVHLHAAVGDTRVANWKDDRTAVFMLM